MDPSMMGGGGGGGMGPQNPMDSAMASGGPPGVADGNAPMPVGALKSHGKPGHKAHHRHKGRHHKAGHRKKTRH